MDDYYPEFEEFSEAEADSEPFRFACVIITHNQAPLLAKSALATLAMQTLVDLSTELNGQLWGYVVLPDAVHCVIEVEHERDYHLWVEQYKQMSETRLCEAIQVTHPDLLDDITQFNPAWSEVIYRFWQDGYHTQSLASPYAVSNRVADLVRKPVELGLVEDIGAWQFSSYQHTEE